MFGDNRYNQDFYHGLAIGSEASAAHVVPVLKGLLKPKSVLDVGSGIGSWLGQWIESGVSDVVGVDGDYVDRSDLRFPLDCFRAHDLTTPLDLGRRFDLVSTVEVAEHIPAMSADVFVETLVRHSDTVLFSAAIPGQTGTGHINEQWPSYWAAKFETHGLGVYDVLRGQLWNESSVEVWYRQNLLIFATKEAADRAGLVEPTDRALDIVHPELWTAIARRPFAVTVKQAILDSRIGPVARAVNARFRRN